MYALDDIYVAQKKVVLRADLNLPIEDGVVTNLSRLEAVVPTIRWLLDNKAAVIILSHFGRPTEGEPSPLFSLEPLTQYLSEALHLKVGFARDYLAGVDINPGEVVLCENVRFFKGEKSCDEKLSKQFAALGDIVVMDAFGASHRAQASTLGLVRHAKIAVAGFLMQHELESLDRLLTNPQKPVVAIVGGAKVSSKLTLLKNILPKVQALIVGGGIANTFLAATGVNVGKSLVEAELINEAREILELANTLGVALPLPDDVVVAKKFSVDAEFRTIKIQQIQDDDMILDIGKQSVSRLCKIIENAGTILWNGPVGVFEMESSQLGTKNLGIAVANSSAFSVAGGGDTLAAIDAFGLREKISYISTGGGAFLEFLEGRTLPVVAALREKAHR